MNDLVVIPKENALEIFITDKGLDPYLQKIREEIDSFVPDISTEKGRKEVASMAHKVARSKTALDDVGKQLVTELKEKPKLVDAERKRMRDLLDSWKDEVRKPLTEFEEKEKARIAKHEEQIRMIQDTESIQYMDVPALKDAIKQVEKISIDDSWEEFEAKAAAAVMSKLKTLREALAKQEKLEAEKEELEKLRKEAEERERKEREERIAREAAEKAKLEAEEKARIEREESERKAREEKERIEREALESKLAAEKAEREKIEAQQRAERAEKEAREKADRELAEKKAQEEKEAAEREANKKHKAAINNKACEALVKIEGVNQELAKEIVTLIAKGEVPNVKINY